MIKSLFGGLVARQDRKPAPLAGVFSKVGEARKEGSTLSDALDGIDRTTIAAAVLMVEVARLDTDYSGEETDRICSIMRREFGMSLEQANALLDTAEARHEEAYTNWLFTKTIKEKAGLEERARVMEYLWDIAFADGELHELEADLLLRIGNAMELPENLRITALLNVLAKHGSTLELKQA